MNKKKKVRFELENVANGETLWAEEMGNNLFRLLNIPFYATGYAENDIVRCVDKNEWKQVVGLEHDSGNGTIRLLFRDVNDPDAKQVLKEIRSAGCNHEFASRQLVAVNVPPNLSMNFSQLSNYLNDLSENILIGWEVAKRFRRSE